ncbi:MAG: hypothetical protein ACI841_003987, partial [Planctomycetota bacterium]
MLSKLMLPFSAAAGAAVLTILVATSSCGHTNAAPMQSSGGSGTGTGLGAAHPASIVNFAGDPITIQAFGRVTLFEVPSNRWFVLNDLSTSHAMGLYEERGGTLRRIAYGAVFASESESGGLSSAVGYAFAPGSKVVVANSSATPIS